VRGATDSSTLRDSSFYITLSEPYVPGTKALFRFDTDNPTLTEHLARLW